MSMNFIPIVLFYFFSVFATNVFAEEDLKTIDQEKVIKLIKNTKEYIKANGKEQAISEFRKNANSIFVIAYDGRFLVSPIYPELIGTNQINFKDSSGIFVVQEEIEKAKAGGGWLKGRWRKNHETGTYECRKIYILPMADNYLIGSWYYYPSDKKGNCLI